MNKTDIIKEVAVAQNIDEATVRLVFNGLISSIQSNLIEGYNVKIKDFLNMTIEIQNEVRRKNPKTQEYFISPKHYRVKVSLPVGFKNKLKKKAVY